MFTTILYGFGMISMEQTWTDAVFTRTTVVFFCEEMEVLQMSWNFLTIFLEQKRPRSFVEGPEGEGVGHQTPGRA